MFGEKSFQYKYFLIWYRGFVLTHVLLILLVGTYSHPCTAHLEKLGVTHAYTYTCILRTYKKEECYVGLCQVILYYVRLDYVRQYMGENRVLQGWAVHGCVWWFDFHWQVFKRCPNLLKVSVRQIKKISIYNRFLSKHLHCWHYLIASSLFYFINSHFYKFATSHKNIAPMLPT